MRTPSHRHARALGKQPDECEIFEGDIGVFIDRCALLRAWARPAP